MECFSNIIEVVPTYAEHLLAAFPSLCSPTRPKPSQLNSGRVIVKARSSDAALHHSPFWSNSPYRAWKCVFGHCPVKKQMTVTLNLMLRCVCHLNSVVHLNSAKKETSSHCQLRLFSAKYSAKLLLCLAKVFGPLELCDPLPHFRLQT